MLHEMLGRARTMRWKIAPLVAITLVTGALWARDEDVGDARIKSVTPISPKAWQKIVIGGEHFGVNPPLNGCPDHLRVTDVTTTWSVPAVGPFGGCQAGIYVTSWTDREIVIEGFPSFKHGQDAFKLDDVIKIEVSNAQQGGPMAWYSVRVGEEKPGTVAPPPDPIAPPKPDVNPRRLGFSSGQGLDPANWKTDTPLLADFGRAANGKWVEPRLSFDQAGTMRMGGVDGTYRFTGIQSKNTFSPPFVVRATVMGTVAHGNAFGLYLSNGNREQGIGIEGNVNRRNGGYHGVWLSSGKVNGANLVPDADVNQWYTFAISVNAEGVGAVTVADSNGNVIGSRNDLPAGLGQFFVILGQREGAPYTVGANEAVWSSVEVEASDGPSDIHAAHDSGPAKTPSAASGNIHSVDFLNFDYRSSCLDGVTHVTKGEWKDESYDSFKVVKILYADVAGSGADQALVHTMYVGGNWACHELYLFAASPNGPRLLARLKPDDWGKGEEDNGADFAPLDVQFQGQQLTVRFPAAGFHACPKWEVTAKFQWKANSFVRTGVTRTPFRCR